MDLGTPLPPTQPADLAEALAVLAERRALGGKLPPSTDHAWAMLLALFAAERRSERLSVSDLCGLSGAPLTTAFRAVLRMEDRRMVMRLADPRDHRRSLVALSDPTRNALAEALGDFLAALVKASG